MRLSEIVIGERARKDMGDLATMAESMKRHGLLHPVVVLKDKTLVAGQRRIEAARLLGWEDIPVTVVDVADLLSAERDENEVRKDFTPSEAVAIGKMIEEQVRPLVDSQGRKRISDARKRASGQITEDESTQINNKLGRDTREIVGAAVGMSGPSYHRAKAVIAAAEADPKRFGDLPAKMDQSGNVSGTYQEMRRRKNGAVPNPKFTGKPGKRRGIRSKNKDAQYQPITKRQIQLAEAQKAKMIRSLSTVTGHCRGLTELDVPMTLSVCNNQDIKTWAKRARELSRTLRTFASKLERGLTNVEQN